MRYLFLVFICAVTSGAVHAQATQTYDRLRIHLQNHTIQDVAELGLEADHGEYYPGKFIVNDYSRYERSLLDAAGFTYEVVIEDVGAHYADPHRESVSPHTFDICDLTGEAEIPIPQNFTTGSMAGFYTYEEMEAILLDMQEKFPDLIHGPDTIPNATTIEGRPIYWLRISDNPSVDEADEPEILYNALHHAREPGSLMSLIFFMWHMLENYDTDPHVQYLVDESELYFIPCINPDGYIYNQVTNPDGGGLWRKNRRENVDGSFGVDLNRNYGFMWGFDDAGSSPSPPSQTYRGTDPFSEPETQAVREFCQDHQFAIALNYHTHGNLLIYPWGFSDMLTPDSTAFIALSEQLTSRNNYLAGTGSETVGYSVNGISDDWMYGETGEKPKIFSMTPEVGANGFWPPLDEVVPQTQQTLFMNLSAAGALHNQATIRQLDDAISRAPVDSLHFLVQHTGLTGGDITVTVSELETSNVDLTDATQTVTLAPFGESELFYPIDLATVAPGSSLRWLIEIDNGVASVYDTLFHIYLGDMEAAFADRFDNLLNWEPEGEVGWFLTDEEFVSEDLSMTDSPFTNYAPQLDQRMRTREALEVPEETVTGFVFFQAQWDIEQNFDFVQLHLIVNDVIEIPLCGKYSSPGSVFQIEGEPLWDGLQRDWVQEYVDISEFIAPDDQVRFRFSFESDNFVSGDGFYVDDFSVYFLPEIIIDTDDPVTAVQHVRLYPQPADDLVQVQFARALVHPVDYALYTATGQRIQEGQWVEVVAEQAYELPVNALAPGIYFLRLHTDNEEFARRKVVVH